VSRKQRNRMATGKRQTPATKPAHTWMGLKSTVTIVLLLFVATSVAYLVLSDSPVSVENPGENSEAMALLVTAPSSEATEPVVAAPGSGSPDKVEEAQHRVIAYYFHGTARCATCRAIEQYTYDALVTGFSGELQSETLEWHTINVEEPDNQHFIDEYELIMRSVVLADMAGENQIRWKNLDRIWDLVGDKGEFVSYVQAETRAYLEED
jgi:hypothetical protein